MRRFNNALNMIKRRQLGSEGAFGEDAAEASWPNRRRYVRRKGERWLRTLSKLVRGAVASVEGPDCYSEGLGLHKDQRTVRAA